MGAGIVHKSGSNNNYGSAMEIDTPNLTAGQRTALIAVFTARGYVEDSGAVS